MKAELKQFVEETESVFGRTTITWRKALFPEISSRDWIDSAILAGEAVPEIIRGIRSGLATDADFNPQVLQAFHLQYPNVDRDFTDFVREHQNPDQLRGIFSGVKGKLFELRHVANLNDHLPEGYIAHLAESPTQPGYDIIIEGPDHHFDYLQDKFTGSLSLLRRAAERWPEIDIAVPHDVAAQIKDPDLLAHVIDTGISGDDLHASVEHDMAVASVDADFGFHLPFLAPLTIAADESYKVWKGKTRVSHAWKRFKWRSTRTVTSNIFGQVLAVGTGVPVLILASIPCRLLWGRYDVATYYVNVIGARRERINNIQQSLQSGAMGRPRAQSLARTSLLLSSNAV